MTTREKIKNEIVRLLMLFNVSLNRFLEFFIVTDLRSEKVATFLAEPPPALKKEVVLNFYHFPYW